METEIWKDIEWYEWKYQVSNIWRIKSFKLWREAILIPWKWRNWYSLIWLTKDWINNSKIIHRLVAQAFIENILNLPLVCHKDETLNENWLLNNSVDNLWWWTMKDNMEDMIKKWRQNNIWKNNHPNKWKLLENSSSAKAVSQFNKDWVFIKKWMCMKSVELSLWIDSSCISSCCRWRQKTAGGYIWKYYIWE